MALWNVLYTNWQMECCGTPFAVGDEVTWPLLLLGPDDLLDAEGWEGEFSEIDGPMETHAGFPLVRVPGGPVVALRADAYEPGPPPARRAGLLSVERHGGEWPDTAGRVRSIHIVTLAYAKSTTSGAFEPVSGERWLRRVDACPKWFGRGEESPEYHRSETGVLVALEVPGDSR